MSHGAVPTTVLFDFSGGDLAKMVAACADDVLLPVLTGSLSPGASVLEAGAGSGRWVKALADRGYAMTGLELNPDSVAGFHRLYPDIPFDHGDVEALPYPDASFDGLISLGVIEHLFHGPEKALSEACRVLKPGGRLILTVPHANLSFRLERLKDALSLRLYSSPRLRALLRKRPLGPGADGQTTRLARLRQTRRPGLPVKYSFSPHDGIQFYEYRFTVAQLTALLAPLPLAVEEIRVLYPEERLYQVFGRCVGRYDGSSPPVLNRLGRWMVRHLPAVWIGHMLLISARKRNA